MEEEDGKKKEWEKKKEKYANQGFCVSQTALKTLVFQCQKEMFLSLKKATKRLTF